MSDDYIPTKEQIEGLNELLKFLWKDKMHWYNILTKGNKLVVNVEAPKGEIHNRIFEVNKDGGIDDDGFREILQGLD